MNDTKTTKQYTQEELENIHAFFRVVRNIHARLEQDGVDIHALHEEMVAQRGNQEYGKGV